MTIEDQNLNTSQSVDTIEPVVDTTTVDIEKSPVEPYVASPYADRRTPLYSFGLTMKECDASNGSNSPSGTFLRSADPKWAHAYSEAFFGNLSYTPKAKVSINLENGFKSGDWGQYVERDGSKLRMAKPKIQPSTSSELLTGTAAISKVQSLIGIGSYIRIPLWASGIWLTLKAPSISELLNLNIKLNELKQNAGRDTVGAIFSNRQALLLNDVTRFIVEHIYDCSIKNWTEVNLFEYILSVDLYPLIHAQATAIYPEGYPHEFPCIADPATCNRVTKVNLNLGKMLWTNRDMLSPEATAFMARAQRQQTTLEEVTKYQEAFHAHRVGTVEVSENIKLSLRIATAEEFIASAGRWISELTDLIADVATENASQAERQQLIRSHMFVVRLREYSHYIKRIVIVEGEQESYVEEVNSIESVLTTLSDDVEIVEKVIEGVASFIESSVVTIVGLPNFACACGKAHRDEDQLSARHKRIVPVDTLEVFTKLMERRLSQTGK